MNFPKQLSTRLSEQLEKIAGHKDLNAFVRLYPSSAQNQLDRLNQIAADKQGKIKGKFVGLKDNFCYKDHPVQAASKILEGFTSTYSATAVIRLLKEGAVILGHQNCDEFAMGTSTSTGCYGATYNPVKPDLSAGGSSGGGASAVAAGLCDISLGTDSGGSARQPAAFCGVIGLAPTYGRISRYGVIALASSLDRVSILTKDLTTSALALESIAGHDPKDTTSSKLPVPSYRKELVRKEPPMSIAYLPESLNNPFLQQEIKLKMKQLLTKINQEGHQVASVSFPLLKYALSTYHILLTSEASANLARYDGMRFGYRSRNGKTTDEIIRNTRMEAFGAEVKRRILLGTFVLSSENYESYYLKAQKVRSLIQKNLCDILKKHDFILLPTTPTTAFKLKNQKKNPIENYLADTYTTPASLAGLPAISIPYGTDRAGLPIGLQIIGKHFDEAALLRVANYFLKIG